MPPSNEKTFTRDEVQDLIKEALKEVTQHTSEDQIAKFASALREAQKPYTDPLVLARKNHEQKEFRLQEKERDENIRASQSSCPHKDKQERTAISLQHNFHDNLPRGLCSKCNLVIHPSYWDWRPETMPDGEIKNKAFIVQEHPLYWIVRQIEMNS